MKKKAFSIIEITIFCLISAILMGFSCSFIMYRHYEKKEITYSFSDVTSDKALAEFLEKYTELNDEFYEDIDKDKLIESAISGMLNYLGDPYTSYLDEDSASNLLEQLDGTYTGVGIEVTIDESSTISITKVFTGGPAEKAGMQVGDIFVSVNGVNSTGKTLNEVTDQIKNGESDTSVIVVLRDGKEMTFTVTRTELYIPSVETKIYNNDIGYMSISTFSSTTSEQVKDSISLLESKNIGKLIIDLRNNGGGYLYSAQSIIEQFLEKGKIMFSIKSKTSTEVYKDNTDQHTTFKIVVLVNGASASASEILTGALKESYGATIVGTTTYGKGKVQQTSATGSGLMKYTSAEWLIPSGVCIDEKGIEPDYMEALSQEYINNAIEENDNQLKKAIEVVGK